MVNSFRYKKIKKKDALRSSKREFKQYIKKTNEKDTKKKKFKQNLSKEQINFIQQLENIPTNITKHRNYKEIGKF